MHKYRVDVYATRVGSAYDCVFRQYIVEADSVESARVAAIDAAYKEGGIEHINPRRVELL